MHPTLARCNALAVLIATPLSLAAAAPPDCASAAIADAAAAARGPRDVVQRAAASNADLDTDLAPATSAAIVALKRQLGLLVDAQVACLAAGPPDVRALDAALAAALDGVAIATPATPETTAAPEMAAAPVTAATAATAGDDRSPAFESTALHDGALLSVVARIGIPCGSDALWLLYARGDDGWRRVLQWTSAPYTRVDGAWEAFQPAVSPRDADGRWFAAAAHIRPWCSSSWSTIDYTVLRPGDSADTPRVVLNGSDSLWWGGDDLGRLRVDATHAELRFHGASLDTGVHNREFVRRYDVSGATPVRIAPVADAPRDFVDEWIVSAWTSARRWSHDASVTVLERAHAQLQAVRKQASFEFGDTTACGDGDAVQVELRNGDDASWFFRVAGRSDYRMIAVATQADPRCTRVLPATGG